MDLALTRAPISEGHRHTTQDRGSQLRRLARGSKLRKLEDQQLPMMSLCISERGSNDFSLSMSRLLLFYFFESFLLFYLVFSDVSLLLTVRRVPLRICVSSRDPRFQTPESAQLFWSFFMITFVFSTAAHYSYYYFND